MKKYLAAAAFAAAISLTGLVFATPASAAPPVATVSPGYDARLAASRPTDVSSRRYYRRYGYYGPRYYRPYYRPYYGYGYGYRPYYRPYYYGGPRFYGPGFGFGFGW